MWELVSIVPQQLASNRPRPAAGQAGPRRAGKPVASRLRQLSRGTVKFDTVLEGSFEGVVVKPATPGREARSLPCGRESRRGLL